MMSNIESNYYFLNRIIEEYMGDNTAESHVEEGDVVLLNKKCLKSDIAKRLAGTGHMFLVLNVKNGSITVATITSQLETLKKFHHYTFKDLDAVPFNKPCGVNLQSVGDISEQAVIRIVGELSERDFRGVTVENSVDRKITQRLEHLLRRGSTR